MYGQTLFYIGIVAIATAVVLATAAVIVLTTKKKRLNKRLDAEFGVRRQ